MKIFSKLLILILFALPSCGLKTGQEVHTVKECYGAKTPETLHLYKEKQDINKGLREAMIESGSIKLIPKNSEGVVKSIHKGLGKENDYIEIMFYEGIGLFWVEADKLEKQ